ncbi:MAG: hypothetical protein U0797_14900 [Gemmataceae bacterium]
MPPTSASSAPPPLIRHTLDRWTAGWATGKRRGGQAREELLQAKASLSYARSLNKGSSVGCVEQEAEINKAKKRWSRPRRRSKWSSNSSGSCGVRQGVRGAPGWCLSGFAEGELRQAIVHLQSRIAALEAYINTAPPS